ncbi:IS66 family insertion sequence element accessory protein TnpB [Paraburkholderia silvatlantica]|uniref:IS66 family insertion sequence element accessory protein TnpB n=1 Tax=Paraburkholderia silvatlantica TaxID=321895 RepID=UPI00375090A4
MLRSWMAAQEELDAAELARKSMSVPSAEFVPPYLFANRPSTRMKVLVYDGFGIWLAARRLNKGRFVWTNEEQTIATALNPEQLRALVTGLPWQTLVHAHAITVV